MLVEDVLSFFKFQTYTQNVVDVLVHAAVDALNLCLYIYQRYENNVQVVWVDGENSVRNVHLKFHRNPSNPSENHYDAIILAPLKKVQKMAVNTSLDPILIESNPENLPPNSPTRISKLPDYNVQNVKQESEVITIIDESPEKSSNKPLSKKPKLELDIKGEDEIEGTGAKKDMFM